ncbi:hypothetical protein H6P81_016711 [Aristolochia fimbriata]|uniref:Uncharacterized protein n=1 Tax=Aristolochia fimbriata TaxID=158543 RepID=A0AAV7EAB7_ARIFI|nr:hypothetical protein H6P81_016711 [Aristolochia fimbriata]
MLLSTVDLISGVASNSLFVFCICNLIIAVLLVSGSRPDYCSPALLSDSASKPSSSSRSDEEEEEGCASAADSGDEECGMVDAASGEKITEEAKEKEEDDDDELRRRAEEFIEKINRIWMAEKMQQRSAFRKAVV